MSAFNVELMTVSISKSITGNLKIVRVNSIVRAGYWANLPKPFTVGELEQRKYKRHIQNENAIKLSSLINENWRLTKKLKNSDGAWTSNQSPNVFLFKQPISWGWNRYWYFI